MADCDFLPGDGCGACGSQVLPPRCRTSTHPPLAVFPRPRAGCLGNYRLCDCARPSLENRPPHVSLRDTLWFSSDVFRTRRDRKYNTCTCVRSASSGKRVNVCWLVSRGTMGIFFNAQLQNLVGLKTRNCRTGIIVPFFFFCIEY